VRSRPTHLLYQVRRAATKRAILRCAYQVSAYGDAISGSGSGLLTLFAQRGGTANLKQNHKAGFIYPPPPQPNPAPPSKKKQPPRAGPTNQVPCAKTRCGPKINSGAAPWGPWRAPEVVLLGYICPIPSSTIDNTPVGHCGAAASTSTTAGRGAARAPPDPKRKTSAHGPLVAWGVQSRPAPAAAQCVVAGPLDGPVTMGYGCVFYDWTQRRSQTPSSQTH
jgi:hypothetical protein